MTCEYCPEKAIIIQENGDAVCGECYEEFLAESNFEDDLLDAGFDEDDWR